MNEMNEIIDRSNTESTKWDRFINELPNDVEMIPLWIADMDLACSSSVVESLVRRAKHPIYGYTDRTIKYNKTISEWCNKNYSYDVSPDNVVLSTGVMYSISLAIKLLSEENDGIMVFKPCYNPFITTINGNNRKVVSLHLNKVEDSYEIDYLELEKKAKESTILLLCNPHNPSGKIFTKEELIKIANICEDNNVRIISDEIHADFCFSKKFFPIMNVNEWTKENVISCLSPTKTFNLAGLKISYVLIKNFEMKNVFERQAKLIGINSINLFAMEALKSAYLDSESWFIQLKRYLKENREILENFIKNKIPELTFVKPEGTYFYWIDFSPLGGEKFIEKLFKKGVILSKGIEFSEWSKDFARINIALPKKRLVKALETIERLKGGE